MIGFTESFLTWLAATIIPAFAGLLVITWAGKKIPTKYIAAFAFGIMFWFFVDTISGSAVLHVNSGFDGGIAQVAVVSLFIIGYLLFFWVDRKRDLLSPQSAIGIYGLTIPLIVAIAVGIHGLGEGTDFGYTAYATLSTSLLGAFGGVFAGVAYVLHKGLEPMMIGACYSVYTSVRLVYRLRGSLAHRDSSRIFRLGASYWIFGWFQYDIFLCTGHRHLDLRDIQACRPSVHSQWSYYNSRATKGGCVVDTRNYGHLHRSPLSFLQADLTVTRLDIH